MDKLIEELTRGVARRASRRGFIATVGRVLVGSLILPLLPVDRVSPVHAADKHDGGDRSCDFWKYCAIDGYLCSCCGGDSHDCPPGATPSPTSWVGTCRHPGDGKDYIVSYRDCCGNSACGRCMCTNTVGEMPIYRTQLNSDLVWCFGAPNMIYHCSTAEIVGLKS